MGDGFRAQRIDPHWPRDVLDLLFAHVLEGERKPLANVVADGARNADPARLSALLQPGSDVHSVTEDIVFLNDYVAKIDPDAEPDPALLRHVRLAVDHSPLDLYGASHGVDHARELGQQALTGILHDPTAVLLDLRINQLAQMRLQAFVRLFFIGPHQPRITGDVGRKDRSKAAGCSHCSGTPAARQPWNRRSPISPTHGMFLRNQASESFGCSRSTSASAIVAASIFPCSAHAGIST